MADDRRRNRSRSQSSSRDYNKDKRSRRSSACSSNQEHMSKHYSRTSSNDSDHRGSKERKRPRKRSSSSSSENRKSTKKKKKSKKKKRLNRSSSRSSTTESYSSSESCDSEPRKMKSKKSKCKTPSKFKKKKKKAHKKVKTKRTKSAVNQNRYGRYGILTEADQFTKQPEFYCWLQETKHVNPEIISRMETKKMFESFMEDYNTATLPHKKFYDLAKWEMKKDAKRKMKEWKNAQKNPISFADDESNHVRNFKGEEKRYGLSKERILEMKQAMKERSDKEYKKNVGY